MLTCIIYVMEGGNVAVADIPSALLQTEMVLGCGIMRVRLCSVLADLLVKIDPDKFAEKFFLEGG